MTYGIWIYWFNSKEYGLWAVGADDAPLTFPTKEDAQAAADAMGFDSEGYEIKSF